MPLFSWVDISLLRRRDPYVEHERKYVRPSPLGRGSSGGGCRATRGASVGVRRHRDRRDGYGLVAAADTLTPDVIITDIAMPGLDGMAAAGAILGRNPRARIVLVTVHNDTAMVQQALATGVLGYVLKLTAGEELVPATHAALDGV
jgi:DNA-binding NarL/FixJ family response regulator